MNNSNSISDVVRQLSRFMKRHKHSSPRSSHRYMHLLRLIQEASKARPSELADRMGIRQSSISEMISNLDNDGMIEKTKHENDRRVTLIAITPKGEEKLKDFQEHRDQTFEGILTEEEEVEFIRLSKKMIASLNASHEDHHHHRRGHKHKHHHG